MLTAGLPAVSGSMAPGRSGCGGRPRQVNRRKWARHMTLQDSASRQDRQAQVLVLSECFVKRDDFEIRRVCKCRQICVAPHVWRKRLTLCQGSPGGLDAFGLFCENDAFVDINSSHARQAWDIETASPRSTLGFVTNRKNPICVTRQKQQLCLPACCIHALPEP